MQTKILRLALMGTILSLPALAQVAPAAPDASRAPAATEGSTRPGSPAVMPPATTTAPARTDSIRPDSARQGVAAGQGATTTPGTTMGTGTTTPNTGVAAGSTGAIGALEQGANSFTEGQARSRIEAAGFTNLDGLRKDDNGIWRGRAMRGGQQVEVGLDFRGNVAPITR